MNTTTLIDAELVAHYCSAELAAAWATMDAKTTYRWDVSLPVAENLRRAKALEVRAEQWQRVRANTATLLFF